MQLFRGEYADREKKRYIDPSAFRLKFAYFENEIPRGPGGKFEEFVSKLEA